MAQRLLCYRKYEISKTVSQCISLRALQKFELTKPDLLQVLNLRPRYPVELEIIGTHSSVSPSCTNVIHMNEIRPRVLKLPELTSVLVYTAHFHSCINYKSLLPHILASINVRIVCREMACLNA